MKTHVKASLVLIIFSSLLIFSACKKEAVNQKFIGTYIGTQSYFELISQCNYDTTIIEVDTVVIKAGPSNDKLDIAVSWTGFVFFTVGISGNSFTIPSGGGPDYTGTVNGNILTIVNEQADPGGCPFFSKNLFVGTKQ